MFSEVDVFPSTVIACVFFGGESHKGSGTEEDYSFLAYCVLVSGRDWSSPIPRPDLMRLDYHTFRICWGHYGRILESYAVSLPPPPALHPTHIYRYRPTLASAKDRPWLWPQSSVASVDTIQNDNPGGPWYVLVGGFSKRKAALLKEISYNGRGGGPLHTHYLPP